MSKAVLVTGATRGLGKAVAIGFARTGATVVMVVRDPDRGAAVADRIRAASPDAEVHLGIGDLASINDVRMAVWRRPGRCSARPARYGQG